MTGSTWVISYISLCVVVLALCGGVLHLYHELGTLSVGDELPWPFSSLQPGESLDPLPSGILAEEETGRFVLLTTAEHDSFSSAAAMAAVASDWGARDVHVVVRDGANKDWLGRLHGFHVHVLSPREFDGYGLKRVPVIAYVRGGVVLDALDGAVSPTAIASHFRLVAGPLVQAPVSHQHLSKELAV